MPAFEVVIAEVHVVLLFCKFVHLAELVHVELSDEGGQVLMPEEMRQDLLFQLLTALDDYLVCTPTDEVTVLFGLDREGST